MITELEIIRKKKGYTQKKLAELIGYDNSMISKYERGFTVRVSERFKNNISRVLKTPRNMLFK